MPTWDKAGLNRRILAAHAAGDGAALSALYEAAADGWQSEGAQDAAGFYLTQAYIFALDCGLPAAARLRARLVAMGRETAA